jgi:hypothetical protein
MFVETRNAVVCSTSCVTELEHVNNASIQNQRPGFLCDVPQELALLTCFVNCREADNVTMKH